MRLFILFLAAVCLFSCKKPAKPLTAEEQLNNKRSEDASFNNAIVSGVGNLFYEEKLIPNSTSQLIFKMAVNGDTLAAYGKINSTGQLAYINSTVLAKKGNTELLVTEIFPDISKSRMYTMINNTKSNIVIEIEHYTKTKFTVSVIDLNWATGISKVLKTTYITDGKIVSEFSAFKIKGDRVFNCDEPQPSDNWETSLDNQLDYFACAGLAWDAHHPALTVIKKAITSGLDAIKTATQYKDRLAELELLANSYSANSNLYNTVSGKIKAFKYEKTRLAGILKNLEELINKLKSEKPEVLLLVPFPAKSDLDYDEITDTEVKMTFSLNVQSTGVLYTTFPVFVDFACFSPVDGKLVLLETEGSNVDGLIVFKFDPTTIPNYQNYSSLTVRYAFSKDNFSNSETQTVSLKFIDPKVVFLNGSNLPSPVNFFSNKPQLFKLLNKDNQEIPVNYNDVTINNVTNNKVGYTMFKGTNDFSLEVYTNEPTAQATTFDLFYKAKKVQTINATVNDSIAVYKANMVGNWQVLTFISGALFYTQYKTFTSNGVVLLNRDEPASGPPVTYNPPKVQESWNVIHDSNGYHLAINGLTYPYKLTFPVSYIVETRPGSEYQYYKQ